MTSVFKKKSRRVRTFKPQDRIVYHRGGFEQNVTSPNSPGSILNKKIAGVLQLITKYAVKTIDGYVDPSLAEKSLKSITPNIQKNIETLRNFLMIVKNDDDGKLKEIIKDTISLFSKYLVEVLEESQPDVDIATNKVWQTINDVAEKSGAGFSNASLTTVYAALAEIPGIGGFIVLFGSAGKFFNTGAIIAKEIMDGTNEIKMITDRMITLLNKYIEKYKPKFDMLYNDYNDILKKSADTQAAMANIVSVADEKQFNAPLVKGGGRKKSKNTLKRILSSFNHFTRKNIIKTNNKLRLH